jgi:2-oxoglutarate dehydrogenase E1 component
MSVWDAFQGPNAGYVAELYERYQQDPTSLDEPTRAFFAALSPEEIAAALASPDGARTGSPAPPAASAPSTPAPTTPRDALRIVLAARLARSIREYGHLAARIDPLGAPPPDDPMLHGETHGITDAELAALPPTIVWPGAGAETGTCLDAIQRLRAIYSGPLGYDFDHVRDFAERAWLRDVVESGRFRAPLDATRQRALLRRLSEVEGFERFLHTTFQGQKRFSIEGTDMLVPMLDALIHDAAEDGAREVLLGMAHRGRLNVLAHVLEKPYATIFTEFHAAPNKELVPSEGSTGINYGWTGDVKYHLGASATVAEDDPGASAPVWVKVTMANNPSHLEFVNPVVEGFTRAAQDDRAAPGPPPQDVRRAVAVTVHGDAAFPGEGVVAETLNLSRLPGYQTGGTIHLVANNQLGFTTEPADDRSTLYASDLAKGFEIPIIHVNADDPEACLATVRLAAEYRTRFHKDFLVDLVGYRRWGHNEGDEPSFTQPLLYAAISQHPTVRALYAERLASAGVVTPDQPEALLADVRERLRTAYAEATAGTPAPEPEPLRAAPALASAATAVPEETLRALNTALLAWPEGYAPVSRLERLLRRRGDALAKPGGIDWAHAETLAFASLLAEGTPIRLTGQDTERGTFSQRHLVLHDARTGARYTPLQHLPQARASFAVYNSPLSEAAALGFEYGYSVHAPDALVLWEAQFGDFANAGQVLIDQFIAAARAKWRQHPALVLLLPHGYEGQGPEHSSGRIERYLQLAAEDNLRIANCTTAAQHFHLLRAQAALLGNGPRPLVILTPKSLLRHPRATSSLGDLANGRFEPVLDDPAAADRRERVERLILCSGKVAVDLESAIADRSEPTPWLAVARIEQLYPFPAEAIAQMVAGYPRLREVVWLQEEPRNMGAASYILPLLRTSLPEPLAPRYVGRPERASVAEGMADAHAAEQAHIIALALTEPDKPDSTGERGERDERAPELAGEAHGGRDGHAGYGGHDG